jgi:hypothetical protein
MTLYKLICELTNITTNDFKLTDKRYKKIVAARTAYRNSLRNTIGKEIENACNSSELNELIFTFESQLEQALVIALYRRYLWLEPSNAIMYQKFINYFCKSEQQKMQLLTAALADNDFDSALALVEKVFDNTFDSDSTLMRPSITRSLADIAQEYDKLDNSHDLDSMKKTKAADIRKLYLKDLLEKRINNPNINILDLRDFFTSRQNLFISLNCEFGLAIGKRYFNLNKTDRSMYGYFCMFLDFWNLGNVTELLQFVAVNDFDNALKVVNSIVY